MQTPWGEADSTDCIAVGITAVSTASHGGILLNKERNRQLLQLFPHFQTFVGGSAYEEDSDVCAVYLAFPEFFNDLTVRGAVNTVKAMADDGNWGPISKWLDENPQGQKIVKRARRFEATQADKWESGSMSSCSEGWNVSFTKVSDRTQRKWVKIARYPNRFYSDSELEAAAI